MSDSENDHFVTFGVPLDPLDEDNLPRKKPVTIEDQYAYDAQGRRRFHGAFTGGFSAGYFNSVGTRDGWRPQQFKSSRSSKAENVAQRPEDFMDEEDTSQFGIAPKGIRATSDFADHGQRGTKRERMSQTNDGPIPGIPVLRDLLKPVKETVGVSLLKQMGWKPGQGVGPRITRKEKKKQKKQNDKIKIYGCALPQSTRTKEESDSEDSDNSSEDIMFAPDDYEPFRCNPKDNYFGLGYNGLDRQPVLSAGHINLFEVPAFKMQEKNKKLSIRGQAFGVGAFEADDEDIYQRDDMSRYDFTLEPEKKKKPSRWSKNEANEKHCLEGFTPAKNTLKLKKTFPPPELPENFQPTHVVRKTRFYPPIEPPPPPQNEKKLLNRVKEIVFTSSHVTTPICEEVENPLKEAVKKKMFGKLTHEKIEWKPASIVCKRFNIPEPQSGCALPEMKKKASKFSVFDSLDWCESSKFEKATDGVLTSNQMISPHEASGLKIISNLPKPHVNSDNQSTDEKAKNFEESYEKIFGQSGQKISEIESTNEHIANSEFPEDTVEDFTIESTINNSTEKKDLFKAIFLSSSEDSESEPETNINDEEVVKSVLIGEVPLKANIQRNTSPPRGIFAQLDLDNLITPSTSGNGPENDRTNIDVEIKTESSDNATSTNTVEHCSENSTTTLLPTLMLPDMYGPVLPTTLIKTEDTGVTNAENPQSIFNNSVVSKTHHSTFSGKWVERGKVKKSKKEKKKHKHKVSSKHKRKLKKEKR